VIDETNSVVCWGASGLSNVFGSALWALDYALRLADHGVAGADFHGKVSGCNPYSPVCTLGRSRRLIAQPELYGLLAVRQVGAGRFLRVVSSAPASLPTYALTAGAGNLAVVLDNLGGGTVVALHLPQAGYRRAEETVLATRARRGLYATAGITLGGRRVGADGSMAPVHYVSVRLDGSSITLRVHSYTAVILKFATQGKGS